MLGLSQQRGILNPKPRIIECDVVVVADDDDLIPESFFVLTVVFIHQCRSDSSDGAILSVGSPLRVYCKPLPSFILFSSVHVSFVSTLS